MIYHHLVLMYRNNKILCNCVKGCGSKNGCWNIRFIYCPVCVISTRKNYYCYDIMYQLHAKYRHFTWYQYWTWIQWNKPHWFLTQGKIVIFTKKCAFYCTLKVVWIVFHKSIQLKLWKPYNLRTVACMRKMN